MDFILFILTFLAAGAITWTCICLVLKGMFKIADLIFGN